jgi:hypothetical protein
MTQELLGDKDWREIVDRLGGSAGLEASARETGALVRARVIKTAVDLLRLILAYCLGERGLRATSAWATAAGIVDISNVALLYRLRCCGDWLGRLVGQALATGAPEAAQGRLIRIVDARTCRRRGSDRGARTGSGACTALSICQRSDLGSSS